MTNYVIESEVDIRALMALVNRSMEGGRIPLGGPFVWHEPEEGKALLCQAMIYPPKTHLASA